MEKNNTMMKTYKLPECKPIPGQYIFEFNQSSNIAKNRSRQVVNTADFVTNFGTF